MERTHPDVACHLVQAGPDRRRIVEKPDGAFDPVVVGAVAVGAGCHCHSHFASWDERSTGVNSLVQPDSCFSDCAAGSNRVLPNLGRGLRESCRMPSSAGPGAGGRRVKLLVLLLLTVATQVQGQRSSQALPAPNGRLNVEFSDLSAIRELADGRVVLFDRREERLVVGDFPSGSVYDVARKGQGPAEFESVFALVPLAGDSTIAADMTRRWLILVGDSVVRKMLPEHIALQNASAPIGADGNGRVLVRAYGAATRDSTPIVLVHRASGVAETIARYANEGKRGSTTTPGVGGSFQVRKVPLETAESPLLFSDGWVAVVRIDPYRVDWRAPNGRWTLGRPLPVRAVRITAAEKAAYLTRKPGFRSATDWPSEMPPFEAPGRSRRR